MSGEINTHRSGWSALRDVGDQLEPPKPLQSTEALQPLIGLGRTQVDSKTLEKEQRLRVIGDGGPPLAREQIRSRLEQGLLLAIELGEQQGTAAQAILDQQALSEAKQIATAIAKVIGAGTTVLRRDGLEIPGHKVCPSEELSGLLGSSLAERALLHKVQQLLEPVLKGRGLSVSFTDGKGVRLDVTQAARQPSPLPEIAAAWELGLSESADRRAEIQQLGKQIGAALLTQLVLKAKVAEAAGVNLLPIDRINRAPLRDQHLQLPVTLDLKRLGIEATRLHESLKGEELEKLWSAASIALTEGIKGSGLALPLPFLRCDAQHLTFGHPLRQGAGPRGADVPQLNTDLKD